MTLLDLLLLAGAFFAAYVAMQPAYRWLSVNLPQATEAISNKKLKRLIESMVIALTSTVFFSLTLLFVYVSWLLPALWFIAWTVILYHRQSSKPR